VPNANKSKATLPWAGHHYRNGGFFSVDSSTRTECGRTTSTIRLVVRRDRPLWARHRVCSEEFPFGVPQRQPPISRGSVDTLALHLPARSARLPHLRSVWSRAPSATCQPYQYCTTTTSSLDPVVYLYQHSSMPVSRTHNRLRDVTCVSHNRL
jgi:hypothetical protein